MFGGVVSLQVQEPLTLLALLALCILRFPWRSCTRREQHLKHLYQFYLAESQLIWMLIVFVNLFSLYTFRQVAVCDLIIMGQFDNSGSSYFMESI